MGCENSSHIPPAQKIFPNLTQSNSRPRTQAENRFIPTAKA
jgi:hypothetical protein